MKRRENNNCAASAIKHTTTKIYMLSTNTCTQITMAKTENEGDGYEERERDRAKGNTTTYTFTHVIFKWSVSHTIRRAIICFFSSCVLVALASASLRRLEKLTMTAENCTEDVVSYIYTQQMCNVLMVWLRVRAYVNEWRRMTKRKCPLFFRKYSPTMNYSVFFPKKSNEKKSFFFSGFFHSYSWKLDITYDVAMFE